MIMKWIYSLFFLLIPLISFGQPIPGYEVLDRDQVDQSVLDVVPVRADLPDATDIDSERMVCGSSIVRVTDDEHGGSDLWYLNNDCEWELLINTENLEPSTATADIYNVTTVERIYEYTYQYLGYDTRLGVPIASTVEGTLKKATPEIFLPEALKGEDINLYVRLDESDRIGIPSVVPRSAYTINSGSRTIEFNDGWPWPFQDPYPDYETFDVYVYTDWIPLN